MTKQIMIRFKKQFLFLFSFLFKIPAILSQQAVSNINVSQQSFPLSPFFFLSFFFYLRKCLSRQAEVRNKVHSLIYCWGNRILCFSLFFFFWIHIIPTFRKGRRKNSLSCTYLWQGFVLRFLSFTGEWHPRIWMNVSPFCWLLSKDSVLIFLRETFLELG